MKNTTLRKWRTAASLCMGLAALISFSYTDIHWLWALRGTTELVASLAWFMLNQVDP